MACNVVNTASCNIGQKNGDAKLSHSIVHLILLQHGTDSYIMHTWYVGQALLFSFNLPNLATPL